MKYTAGENIFDKFFQQRQSLIQQFKKGDISKKEYIEESYAYIQQNDIKPFKRVDTLLTKRTLTTSLIYQYLMIPIGIW